MTCWADEGSVHKFPLCGCFVFSPHCFIAHGSAVINVSGVKQVWRCIIFYIWQFRSKGVVRSVLCTHITFTSGSQKIVWKALAAADWRWMSLSPSTCRMNDSLFWAQSSVLILSLILHFHFPFFFFFFLNLSLLPSLFSTCLSSSL